MRLTIRAGFIGFAAATVLAGSVLTAAQGRGGAPQGPATDATAPEIAGVVAGGTKVQVLKDGLDGTEGPIALPDGSVIFSEINAQRLIRIDATGAFSTFLEKTGGTTGLAFDTQGRLFAAVVPWGSTRFAIVYPDSARKVVIDNHEGKPFGRPNDLTIARNGGIYFTDSANAMPRPPEGVPLPAAFYYLPPGATTAVQLLKDVGFPNGVILSRDEKVVYLNNSQGEYLLAFDVGPDGLLTNRRNFARYEGTTTNAAGAISSGADGLAIDAEGRVYAATATGVQVFSPDGRHLGTIPTPRPPQNLAFAGRDKRTLYVVGRGVVSKIEMTARGFAGRAK